MVILLKFSVKTFSVKCLEVETWRAASLFTFKFSFSSVSVSVSALVSVFVYDCEITTNFALCNFLCNRFHSFLCEDGVMGTFMMKWSLARAESAVYQSPTQSERSERHVGVWGRSERRAESAVHRSPTQSERSERHVGKCGIRKKRAEGAIQSFHR